MGQVRADGKKPQPVRRGTGRGSDGHPCPARNAAPAQNAASSISISDAAPAAMVMNSVFTCGSSFAT